MTDPAKIYEGSYKGVPIAIENAAVEGGRKKSIKQFPNRDTQTVEDMGLKPRRYDLDIIISDKGREDYFNYRKRLLAALESEGNGELIHPFYGRIDNVAVTNYSLNDQMTSFGRLNCN